MGSRKTLIGLNLSVFIMMLGVGMVMPLLPGKVVAFTGSGGAVGYLASAFALSYLVLQLPMGAMADKRGFKAFLAAGYLLCAASGVLYYIADGAGLLFLGRVIQGAGEAPLWALAPALLSIGFPHAKGRVMGLYNATLHVGLTFGPLLGIVALKFAVGDRAFLFFSAACAVSASIVLCAVQNPERKAELSGQTASIKGVLTLCRDRAILSALVGISLYGAGYGLFVTTIPSFLLGAKGASQIYVQCVFACFYLAISVSQLLTGPLSDRWGRERFMLLGLGMAGLPLLFVPTGGSAATIATLTVTSLGLGVFYLASMAYLNAAAPLSLKGTISGAYFLFWGMGYFSGPAIASKLGESLGGEIVFYAYSSLLMLEMATMAFVLQKKKNARRAA